MAMEFAQLETLVKDNPDAVALLKDIAPKITAYAELETKVKAMPDLEAKAAAAATLQKDIDNLKAVNADLEGQKSKWKSGATGTQAEMNALQEQIAANKKATEELQAQLKTAADAAATATQQKRETDLKASVVNAGSKLKGRAPEDDFLLLKAKGLTGLDAEGKPFYHKLNEKGEPSKVENADALLTWYYTTDKTRVNASGTTGTGGTHTGTGGNASEGPKNRREARAAFMASRAA